MYSLLFHHYTLLIIGLLIPWLRETPLSWDVTVSDTYADAHVSNTAMEARAAASHSATRKTRKILSALQHTSSLQYPLRQQVSGTIRQLSWSMETGKSGDRHNRRLEGDHVPGSSSQQWLCKSGTSAGSFQNTFTVGCRLVSLLLFNVIRLL